jgi:PAS domain S-box-containing protein
MAVHKMFDVPIDALLRRRVTGGFIGAVLLTLFLSFVSWRSARRADQDAYWVSHTHEVMATIQGTSRDVLETETSARAFALSGQEQLMVHYRTVRETVFVDENALRHLTADNLSQQRRLEVLEPQVRAVLEFSDSIIAKRQKLGDYAGGSDALKIERLIDLVRATTGEMHAEETRLLGQRTQRATAGQRLAMIISIVGAFLNVGSWILAFLVIIREIAISARVRLQLNTLNAELERRVNQRTAALQSEIADRRRTQETVERLAAVVESSNDAIISKTLDGTITAWNRGAEKVFGYSSAEAVGQSIGLLLPPERADEESAILGQIRCGESLQHFETVRLRKDGEKIDVSVTISPIRDSTGAIVGASKIARDITARKRAEEELANSRVELATQTLMLQSVLDSMGEGLIAADQDGNFLIWNDSANKLMGRKAANLPTEQWTPHYKVFLPDEITPCPPDRLPLVRALHGESVQVELMIEHPDRASRVCLEVTARPLKDNQGNLRGGVAVLRDITQRKVHEREIQQLNNELEQKVLDRTAQLEVANKELEAFSYSVSHDLRAPLRHITGFTQILLEDFGSTLDPNAQRYLNRIHAGTQKMGLLVDELLNLARVGRHEVNRRPIQLNSIVAEVIAILQPDISGRQVEWAVADLPTVECDPILVKQIFQNLLANALKFTRSRTTTVIEVGYGEQDGQTFFRVRDNGIGFNMKYVDKLFGVFQRLHRAEDFEGTGIGLATVQRIVNKHGGRVWAQGELDKGATFQFTLGSFSHPTLKNIATVGG